MFKSEYDMRQAGTWNESRQTQTDTICPYCGVGCDLTVHQQEGQIVRVTSPLDHSVTHGNLCIKDGYPIVLLINCLNSVDTSTVLEITFSWYRLVCTNGMMFGLKDSRLRRRHIQSLDPEDIAAYLKEQLDQKPEEQKMYARWREEAVEPQTLIEWIDGKVAKEWGPHAAALAWAIILPVKSTNAVPGAVRQ